MAARCLAVLRALKGRTAGDDHSKKTGFITLRPECDSSISDGLTRITRWTVSDRFTISGKPLGSDPHVLATFAVTGRAIGMKRFELDP